MAILICRSFKASRSLSPLRMKRERPDYCTGNDFGGTHMHFLRQEVHEVDRVPPVFSILGEVEGWPVDLVVHPDHRMVAKESLLLRGKIDL